MVNRCAALFPFFSQIVEQSGFPFSETAIALSEVAARRQLQIPIESYTSFKVSATTTCGHLSALDNIVWQKPNPFVRRFRRHRSKAPVSSLGTVAKAMATGATRLCSDRCGDRPGVCHASRFFHLSQPLAEVCEKESQHPADHQHRQT